MRQFSKLEIYGAEECARSDGSPLIQCRLGSSDDVIIESNQDRCRPNKPFRSEYWPDYHYKVYANVPLMSTNTAIDLVDIDPNDPTLRCELNYNYVTNQDSLVVQMMGYLRYDWNETSGLIVPYPRESGDRIVNAMKLNSGAK